MRGAGRRASANYQLYCKDMRLGTRHRRRCREIRSLAREARRKRMLQHAAASLKNPELSHAWRMIKEDWLEAKEAEREKQQRLKDAQMELGVVGLQAELERVTKEHEKQVTVLERTQASLLEKLTKLDGGAAAACPRAALAARSAHVASMKPSCSL